jgi:hypothetical protein
MLSAGLVYYRKNNAYPQHQASTHEFVSKQRYTTVTSYDNEILGVALPLNHFTFTSIMVEVEHRYWIREHKGCIVNIGEYIG